MSCQARPTADDVAPPRHAAPALATSLLPTAQATGTAMAEAARKPRLETRCDEGEGGRCGNIDIPSAGRQSAGTAGPERVIYYADCFSREKATLGVHRCRRAADAGPLEGGGAALGAKVVATAMCGARPGRHNVGMTVITMRTDLGRPAGGAGVSTAERLA